ncbi:uncharacterized protein FOMMEDRAFT_169625 [Fomitiporia mediterranea MF3/22]|uniref:uncharacterized protein n=1 Tax=Fomitiporia mediterranea (strain MF3/22) TaxID=694068 RepID=UPI0004407630|nr:uncharacterized protein FOMMEDRAFT_169625 [Fomitiporia mediterranea MF3/22]EJD01522.1 hypothetical protein FOMMEDRAFT_169625 [Fomitiporia mediterranea MF3/22]
MQTNTYTNTSHPKLKHFSIGSLADAPLFTTLISTSTSAPHAATPAHPHPVTDARFGTTPFVFPLRPPPASERAASLPSDVAAVACHSHFLNILPSSLSPPLLEPMESVGVLATAIDVRHEAGLPSTSMSSSTSKPKPLKPTSSLRPESRSSPAIRPHASSSFSRQMISSPLRTCPPITARRTPPPIDTSISHVGSQPLERVPTEPASAPPTPQQPTPEQLATLGIKVRDFAYEPSTLPRVPTVRKPYFRDLKRPREESSEEREARKRNEARRLEFNAPRIRPAGTSVRNPPNIPGVGGLSFIKPYELPFSRASSSSSSSYNARPSSSSSSSSSSNATSMQFDRDLNDLLLSDSFGSARSLIPPTGVFFARPQSRRRSPSPPSRPIIRVHDPFDLHTQEFFRQPVRRSGSDSSPFIQPPSHSESQSQPQPESQPESQSQTASNSQPPLPPLTISQTDSEVDSDADDEELIKTPLLTPNGSLIFDDDDGDFDVSRGSDNANSSESPSDSVTADADADAVESNNSVIDTSALPESQVAELLAPAQTGPDDDVSTSQMGLCDSQDLSQVPWQQQSQSQPSQLTLCKKQERNLDVEMREPLTESKEDEDETRKEPASSASSAARTIGSSSRLCTSASSHNAASSPQPRPISRPVSLTSLSRHSSRSRSLVSASSQSLLRRSSITSHGSNGKRRSSRTLSRTSSKGESKANVVTSPTSSSTSLSSDTSIRSAKRYNLRGPTAKKAKLLGMPVTLSAHRIRTRTMPQRAAKAAAAARVSKSAAKQRPRSSAITPGAEIDGSGNDVEPESKSTSPTLRRSSRVESG